MRKVMVALLVMAVAGWCGSRRWGYEPLPQVYVNSQHAPWISAGPRHEYSDGEIEARAKRGCSHFNDTRACTLAMTFAMKDQIHEWNGRGIDAELTDDGFVICKPGMNPHNECVRRDEHIQHVSNTAPAVRKVQGIIAGVEKGKAFIRMPGHRNDLVEVEIYSGSLAIEETMKIRTGYPCHDEYGRQENCANGGKYEPCRDSGDYRPLGKCGMPDAR